MFIWKYINHISTVKEATNTHPWTRHPDEEMKHCQHLAVRPVPDPGHSFIEV